MLYERVLLNLAAEEVRLEYLQCFVLREIYGLPQQEIADIVGIKKNNVSQYASRGLKQLRNAYKKYDKLFRENGIQ